jgi:hypothetical protein
MLFRASKHPRKFRTQKVVEKMSRWKPLFRANGIGEWPPISSWIYSSRIGINGIHCVKSPRKILLNLILGEMLALLKNSLLNLLKVVMNQYGCMICMSVVGLCRLTCNMKNMKGFIITRFDWVVWRQPHRCNRNISMLFYNIIDLLLLDRRVLG